jgi:hypothetical protein
MSNYLEPPSMSYSDLPKFVLLCHTTSCHDLLSCSYHMFCTSTHNSLPNTLNIVNIPLPSLLHSSFFYLLPSSFSLLPSFFYLLPPPFFHLPVTFFSLPFICLFSILIFSFTGPLTMLDSPHAPWLSYMRSMKNTLL